MILFVLLAAVPAGAIMASGEFARPADSPSGRLDRGNAYDFVGALEIAAGGFSYLGSASALSRHWVLTAGHNVDFNDDGRADAGLDIRFHLPGYGSYTASRHAVHPAFTGFGNPSVRNDLSLLHFEEALPALRFPTLGQLLAPGDRAAMVGFGRAGYGSHGYTTEASLTDRRIGFNIVDELDAAGEGILFRYDFDAPLSTGEPGGSLGNALESLIGPGDSGGPLLAGNALVGVNTFTEGYGGRFGDFGGGVALNTAWEWIAETTGLAIPEPSSALLMALGFAAAVFCRRCAARRQ